MNQEDKSRRLFRWAIGYLFHHNENQEERVPFGFSRVVNFAFACELLMKSFLMRDNNAIAVHKLKDLFENLTDDQKIYITGKMDLLYEDHIYDDEDFDFNEVLQEQSDVFFQWRYPFDKKFENPLENKRGHYGFLYHLAKVMLEKYELDYQEFPSYNDLKPTFDAFLPNANYTLN